MVAAIGTILALGLGILAVTGGLILRAGAGEATDCPLIIVLGTQVDPDGPSEALMERISTAYGYLTAHPEAVAVVSGGKGDNEHMAEGVCMFRQLTAMGIAPERIWVEDRSVSTWTNLGCSLDIIEAKTGARPSSVGIVTHDLHLLRTSLQAKRRGIRIHGIPARSASKRRWLYYFLREIAGVWHYLILGGTYS